MTTGTKSDATPDARRWAAGVLDVPVKASHDDAKRAFLRQVRESEFAPAPELSRALDAFAGNPVAIDLSSLRPGSLEAKLRNQLAEFSEQFFHLAPQERRRRWQQLVDRSKGVAPVAAELSRLEAGLDLELPDNAIRKSPRGRLVVHLFDAFPHTALERASMRQGLGNAIEETGNHKVWQKAAKDLLRTEPKIAALDEQFLQRLAELPSRMAKRKKAKQVARPRPVVSVSGGDFGRWAWVAIVAASSLARIISCDKSDKPPQYSYRPDDYRAPVLDKRRGLRFALQWPKLNAVKVNDLIDPDQYDVATKSNVADTIYFTPHIAGSSAVDTTDPEDNDDVFIVSRENFYKKGGTAEQFDELVARAAKRRG